MLNRLDRMTMAFSVEARVPFLDKKLIEYIFNLITINNISIEDNLKTQMIILLCKKNNLNTAQYIFNTLKNKTLETIKKKNLATFKNKKLLV